MSTKYLLNALAAGLLAFAESIQDSADAAEGDLSQSITARNEPHAAISPDQVANADLDTDGLPWDARIHASTKTKTAKGTWTLAKRVDPKVREAVIAELHAMYPQAAAAAPAPTVTLPAAVAATSPLAIPAINVPAVQTSFTKLTDWLAKNTGDGHTLTKEWVDQVFAGNNMTLAQLATPDMQATADLYLKSLRDTLAQMGIAEVA